MTGSPEDTIVAISSAAGHAPRGVVRLSGPQALEIAECIFCDADTSLPFERGSARRFRGQVQIDREPAAPAELYLFQAPRSYTRQHLVELHTVGSPPLLGMIVDAALERGARLAEPGEFTLRALLNGAMDLAEAESVAASIRAQSDAQLRAAQRVRDGALGRRTHQWLERLAELTALVEADIDFAEEPIEFITPKDLHARLAALEVEIEALLDESAAGERPGELPTVLLIGEANAGKSSLTNALSGIDRAIVSAVAGTTRDILSAPLALPGLECMLLDAAGLGHTDDELIQAAQTLTRREAARVDLLCLVLDASRSHHEDAFEVLQRYPEQAAVIAANKSDLLPPKEAERLHAALVAQTRAPVVLTSAKTSAGLGELRAAIRESLAAAGSAEGGAIALSARQAQALRNAADAVARAAGEASGIGETVDRADTIALELREALEAVGAVCGAVTTEALLGQVFANFCIGK